MNISRSRAGWAVALGLLGAAVVWWLHGRGPDESALVSGNGRIEATEIDVASTFPGKIERVLVAEGDFVRAGQTVAVMQEEGLQAKVDESNARVQQAEQAVRVAQSQVMLRQSEVEAAQALVAQREAELDAARGRLVRSQTLVEEGASSRQELDDDRARVASLAATLAAAKAQVRAAQTAVVAAGAQVAGASSNVTAERATLARAQSDRADAQLKAPRDGRVQFLVAQPGEVVGAGGKVLNLVDVSDVYLTFFLPETVAGKVALGSEVRIVLDVAPDFVIPAKVSFVASVAQFTPKTVETASERQKLMFRVKARVDPALLETYRDQVKTGLPGVAWVKLDDEAAWPDRLRLP